MSDEEKKAIEYWKTHMEILHWNTQLASEHYIKVLLELEELKNEVMEKELIIDGMKEDRRIAVEEIQEQYYVSKDKIKAKIEEIDFMIKEINQGHLQKYTVGELLCAKRFLESLLEKE